MGVIRYTDSWIGGEMQSCDWVVENRTLILIDVLSIVMAL